MKKAAEQMHKMKWKKYPKNWGGEEECSHLQNKAEVEAGETGSVNRHNALGIYRNKRVFFYSSHDLWQQSCPVPPTHPCKVTFNYLTSGTFITGRCPECIKLVPYESPFRKHLRDPYSVNMRGWSGDANWEGGFMQTGLRTDGLAVLCRRHAEEPHPACSEYWCSLAIAFVHQTHCILGLKNF